MLEQQTIIYLGNKSIEEETYPVVTEINSKINYSNVENTQNTASIVGKCARTSYYTFSTSIVLYQQRCV